MTRTLRTQRCVVRRVVVATPDHAFDVWTQPEFAKRWSWGRRFETLTVCIDCRTGGVWDQQIRDRETGEIWTFRAEFREVQPGRRLVHSFHWTSDRGTDEGESLVEIDFVPHGTGTEVVIVHSALRSANHRDGTAHGWEDVLDSVSRCLA